MSCVERKTNLVFGQAGSVLMLRNSVARRGRYSTGLFGHIVRKKQHGKTDKIDGRQATKRTCEDLLSCVVNDKAPYRAVCQWMRSLLRETA